MPQIVLKIDVDTYQGTIEGVPNLVQTLKKHQAQATFLFSLGPDHTGWAMRRLLRPGFLKKISRTSVLEHYGIKTLLYGTLLPGPDIGLKCAALMRTVATAGFECGIHTWDHTVWQDNVRNWDDATTRRVLARSQKRFQEIFSCQPTTHGAAGWQMNEFAFFQLDHMGLQYASDSRAPLDTVGALLNPQDGPYKLTIDGKTLSCIQIPTTLPTLDEMLGCTLGQETLGLHNIANHLLNLTKVHRDHVYTLHAELEGQKLSPIFNTLLKGWQAQGYSMVSMGEYFRSIKSSALPTRTLHWGELPGRSGELVIS